MKKALLVTTVSGFVPQFEMGNVRMLQEMGYEIHYAANYNIPSYGNDNRRLDGTHIIKHHIDFVRSPYNVKNFIAYRQLKRLMKAECFELVHFHTPMGGAITRIAAHSTATCPVIYTVHGFHFYKGAPLKNWLIYYPIEKSLSRITDQLICINHEDYQIAQTLESKYTDYIPGAGIDMNKICNKNSFDIEAKKRELNIPLNKNVLLSVGELIKRKNHESVLRALDKIRDNNLIYIICGHGELETHLKNQVRKLGLQDHVLFLGYRSDIMEIYKIADIFVFPSYQEGLPMALLEAMANELPILCTNIRGSRDLMGNILERKETSKWNYCDGGIMVRSANDVETFADVIKLMVSDAMDLSAYGARNRNIVKDFTCDCVAEYMGKIYSRFEDDKP